MKTIRIDLSKSYDVIVGSGIVSLLPEKLREINKNCRIMLVSDKTVYGYYGEKVLDLLNDAGYQTDKFIMESGETSKNKDVLFNLLETLAEKNFHRTDMLIALGGGVVGDVTGFAASVYMRGIDFVQIPTTLLSAVDSSVGGKTAVNLNGGKNLAGAFYQPRLVVCDTDFLKTLPETEFSSGMAEVIKYGMITDIELFEKLENGSYDMEWIICRCIQDKRDIIKDDEFDKDKRALLNFGHTIGHAIEKVSGYKINHGNAVSVGMVMISAAANKAGMCEDVNARLIPLLGKYNLPTVTDCSPAEIASAALKDKKTDHDGINIVIPEVIGKCRIYCSSVYELVKIIELGVN